MIPNYPPTHVDIRMYMPRGYIQYHDAIGEVIFRMSNKLLIAYNMLYDNMLCNSKEV